jgi:hypothetical protein
MPGIRFAYTLNSGPVAAQGFLLANSLSGTGTPPANYLRGGEPVVLTTKSTLTSGGIAVTRQLLAADKTAHYKEGTPVAGILGISEYDCATDANGVINANVPPAGVTPGASVTYNFPSMAQGIPPDSATNRSRVQIYLAGTQNVFVGALDSATASHALDGTLAGLILTTASGVTTYTIDTGAAAADQCLVIIKPDESDSLYNAAKGRVFFQFIPTFCQAITGVSYSTQ